MVEFKFPARPQTREELLADDELRDFFVWWDDIASKDVRAFGKVLASAKAESPLQDYLARNPLVLIQHLGGGHGR